MAFQSSTKRVQVGPGTLYIAALGSAEPTTVSAAWPSAWNPVGYTNNGSTFTQQTTFQGLYVEEELLPLLNAATQATAAVTFAMAEVTARNLQAALNGGLGANSDVQGTTDGGATWIAPPTLGLEQRVMVGWDSSPKAGTGFPNMRLILRQCIQTGNLSMARQKGVNYAQIAATFTAEIPAAAGTANNGKTYDPFVILLDPALNS